MMKHIDHKEDDNIDNFVKYKAEIELPNLTYCVTGQLLQMNRICSGTATAGVTQPSNNCYCVKNCVFCSCYSCKDWIGPDCKCVQCTFNER